MIMILMILSLQGLSDVGIPGLGVHSHCSQYQLIQTFLDCLISSSIHIYFLLCWQSNNVCSSRATGREMLFPESTYRKLVNFLLVTLCSMWIEREIIVRKNVV